MVSLISGVQFLKEFGIFATILPFMLIFAVMYGILMFVQPFGGNDDANKALHAIIAFVVAFMSLQFMPIVNFIQSIVPYLFALFLIIMLIIVLFRFMGVSSETMQATYAHPAVYGTIIVVLLIGIFVFVGDSFPELDVSNQGANPVGSSGSSLSSIGGSGLSTDRVTDYYTVNGDYVSGSDANAVVTETAEGTVTVLPDTSVKENQDLLRNTIFHPTILSLLVMFLSFAVAAYYIVVIKVL
jgi:hypothetical protein